MVVLMSNLDLNFVCRTFQAACNGHAVFTRVVTDSRIVEKGDLFFALSGERFDGHDYVRDVTAKGAWAVVSRADCVGLPQTVAVSDTLAALQQLAQAWRQEINPLVLGITGSSGKTTVKEMTACVLRHTFGEEAVLATAGNFNNHIGLPLTLLSLQPHHRFAVIEMGMSGFGELDLLTRLAAPNVAVVNNAQRAHVGCGFNGVADIARAKSEIYHGLPSDGVAVVPIEDAHADILQQGISGCLKTTFGIHNGDFHADDIQAAPLSTSFQLVHGADRTAVCLPVPGLHNVHNAVAAAVLAHAAGLSLPQIADGLSVFTNIKGRLNIRAGQNGSTLIDDTYNANPESMKAALDVLVGMDGAPYFVMGDIGELGEDAAPAMHAEVGAYARDKGVQKAWFVGKNSRYAAEAFGANGCWFADKDALLADLLPQLNSQAVVLIKGSRFMKMETVVATVAA